MFDDNQNVLAPMVHGLGQPQLPMAVNQANTSAREQAGCLWFNSRR